MPFLDPRPVPTVAPRETVAIPLPSVLSVLASSNLSLNKPIALSQPHDLGNYVSSLLSSFLHVLSLFLQVANT